MNLYECKKENELYLWRNQQEITSPLISFIGCCCDYGGSCAKSHHEPTIEFNIQKIAKLIKVPFALKKKMAKIKLEMELAK